MVLQAIPDARRLRAWHDLRESRPHVACTPGDRQVADAIEEAVEVVPGLEPRLEPAPVAAPFAAP